MTIETALRDACFALDRAGVESVRTDARLLMRFVLKISLETLLMETNRELTETQQTQFESLVAMRATHRPMAQILGQREFWGHYFKVNEHTLIPRPDSETLITGLLAHKRERAKKLRILDLGTGTGCLLLSALSEYPLSMGLGVDISEKALAVARENAQALGLAPRAEFKKSVWNSEINGVWDVVLSNPPYIPTADISGLSPDVALYEPRLALDGGSSGLDCYHAIIGFLPSVLAEDGLALLEVGAGQAADVAALATTRGLTISQIMCDLAGVERCIIITKTRTVP